MLKRNLYLQARTDNLRMGDELVAAQARITERLEQLEKERVEIEEQIRSAAGPLDASDLVFAATVRCACGLGMAYPKYATQQGHWECSGVLMENGDREVKHTPPMPFMYYEIKSESQPSANGASTRP